jgi:hypothetical protein
LPAALVCLIVSKRRLKGHNIALFATSLGNTHVDVGEPKDATGILKGV